MPPLVRGRVPCSERLGHPEKHFTGIKKCQHRPILAAPQSERCTTLPPALRRKILPHHRFPLQEGGRPGASLWVRRRVAWREGCVGTSSGTGTVVDMNASTTCMIRLLLSSSPLPLRMYPFHPYFYRKTMSFHGDSPPMRTTSGSRNLFNF